MPWRCPGGTMDPRQSGWRPGSAKPHRDRRTTETRPRHRLLTISRLSAVARHRRIPPYHVAIPDVVLPSLLDRVTHIWVALLLFWAPKTWGDTIRRARVVGTRER